MAEELQSTQPALREASQPDALAVCRWAQWLCNDLQIQVKQILSLDLLQHLIKKELTCIFSKALELYSLESSFPQVPALESVFLGCQIHSGCLAPLLSSAPNKSLQFYAFLCCTISLSPPLWVVEMLSLCFPGLFGPWGLYEQTSLLNWMWTSPRQTKISHSSVGWCFGWFCLPSPRAQQPRELPLPILLL